MKGQKSINVHSNFYFRVKAPNKVLFVYNHPSINAGVNNHILKTCCV